MYTHQISYESTNNHLGRVHHTFRTTEDAVQMHMDTLKEREAAGAVRNVTVHKLALTGPSNRRRNYFVVNDINVHTGRWYSRVDAVRGASHGDFTYEADALLLAEELEHAFTHPEPLSSKRSNGQPLDTEE